MSFTVISCKKDPAKKAFLTGRLIDGCNGSPVANQELQFYRNFKESNSWLISDTEQKLLETTTTNEKGVFYFYLEDYTNENMSSYANGSVRIENNIIATGNLGKHYKAEADEFSNPDVGDLLLNGMNLDLNLKIANNNQGSYYDSVKLFNYYYNVDLMLTDSSNGYFTGNLTNQKLTIKNFWSGDNNGYYNLYVKIDFYKQGSIIKSEWVDRFYQPCSTSGEFTFEL